MRCRQPKSHDTNFPNGSTLDSRNCRSTSQQQSRFKSQVTHDYGSPVHTATAGRTFNKRLFSRSQPYRESNTPPLMPQQTNQSPTCHTDSLHNQQRHAFRAKRSTVQYISKDSQPIRKPAARRFTSGISSTDYTEGRKPSLMYGH